MVSTLLKSSLREIRQSLGRYLAILAIVGLGVGFFAGLRMSQPSMEATGVAYLDRYDFHDFRLLSTLGFTQEDVDAFAEAEGIGEAWGSVYTEFLWQRAEDEETVLVAHMLTEGINEPELLVGRMPEKGNECLADAEIFTAADIGRTIRVSPHNDEDTLDLLVYEEYTVVGVVRSPLYLSFERGTASIGSGSVAAFLLMPEEGFDYEAYYEVYLRLEKGERTYSDAYEEQIDAMKPQLEAVAEERGDLRYETLYADAMEEIRDGEEELADGWEEYRTERSDAEEELADAKQELEDGEQEYADGLADYEQGKIDYADGVKEIRDAEKELADGWIEYEDAKADALQQLADAKQELEDGEKEYADGLAELEDAKDKLKKGKQELSSGNQQMSDAKQQLDSAKQQLDQGNAGYQAASGLYQMGTGLAGYFGAGSAAELLEQTENDPMTAYAVNEALKSEGSSLNEFKAGWSQTEQQLGSPLTAETLEGVRQELDEGQKKYDVGMAQYQAGASEMAAANLELIDAQKKLEKAEAELADARRELDDGWKEYYEAEAEAMQELADAEQELRDGEQELADARNELASAKRDLDKAPEELADARQELDDGWKEYEEGLAEAEQEFADAEAELADGEQEIADAYVELEDLREASTYVLTRSENAGYYSFDNDISIIAAISVVFPVFFFLVAALVCMTTMKRMVDEQRTQIGVLKALGYGRSQIIGKYLLYSGSAATVGSVLGYAIGSTCLPLVIWEIYGIMYGFAPLKLVFNPILATTSFAAALLCSMGATWLSCRVELQKPAAELIRPKSPKAGKRVFLEYITPLWKRLSFLRKVSVRNVLRYRSRLVMMILGIGGCTALLVTGFGIRDSIASIVDDQYDQITLYDFAVNFQEPQTQEQAAQFLAERGWEENMGLLVHSGSTDVVTDSGSQNVYLVLSAEERLDGFISLHDGERAIPYPEEDKVVVTVGLAQELGLAVGDTVQLRDESLGTVEVTVSDICLNYTFNYVFVSPKTYQKQLNTVPAFKTLYVMSREGADPFEEGVLLSGGEGISNVTVNEATRQQVNTTLSRLNILVVVVVVCAAALAFIVLYNLTNINITERIREIATIKVLGFFQNETAAYVFREIRLLSMAGSLVGLLMGKALHAFVMAQVQVNSMFFPCKITPFSYLISFALTMVFSVLITWGMRPRLRKIDMAESLKSIE